MGVFWEITWPSDLDARVVFRSAEFAKYFIILSVNFKTFCIGLIMNTSTVKGDRKREIGQSPIKKKFRAATISREDIDEAIANGIKLAFKKQQSTLDSIVTSAVRAAVDSVLIPALRKLREDIQATNNSVKEPREEFEAMAAAAMQTRDRVDSVQATTREDRSVIMDLRNQLERLAEKMTDMEDKSRRNNIRLVGLPEGMEGSDVAGFLRINLSRWIPSLKGRDNRDWPSTPRVWWKEKLRSAAYSHLPCTKMAWQIGDPEGCSAGLSGENARRTMSRYYFFLTLVQLQPPREKAWFRFWDRWRRLVSSPSSLILR